MAVKTKWDFESDPLIERILDPVGFETKLKDLMNRKYWSWRRNIMPKVEMMGTEGCYVWGGMTQRVGQYYYPIINVPKSHTANLGTRRMHVVQFVARMFWKFPEGYTVYHKCFIRECVNPDHFSLGPRGLTEYKD